MDISRGEKRSLVISFLTALAISLVVNLVYGEINRRSAMSVPQAFAGGAQRGSGGARMGGNSGGGAENARQLELAKKEYQLLRKTTDLLEQEFQSGARSREDVDAAQEATALSALNIMRLENGVRMRGNSAADLVVKRAYAEKAWKHASARYQAGGETLLTVTRLELAVLQLDRQLEQMSRITDGAEFQKAAAAWTADPTENNLKELFYAERDATPSQRGR